MKIIKLNYLCLFLFVSCSFYYAQISNPKLNYTLLSEIIIDELIGESSGELAMNHIIEMGGYIHDRKSEEYQNMLWESEYVYKKLLEYGFTNAKVEKFSAGKTWDGISATMWEISPKRNKLADYKDLPAVLASGSKSCNLEAEIIWISEGKEKDYLNIDVKGKIVLTSSNLRSVSQLAFSKGAVGIISFYTRNPLKGELSIPISGFQSPDGKDAFAFYLTPRDGYILRDRILYGEKIKVSVKIESQIVDNNLEIPTCLIEGTDKNAKEIIFSAHLFEGLVKQGANDNISGSAAILEVARTLKVLIDEKRIPAPKRSIRFIWVPEYSGTIPWVKEHREIIKNTLCNINLDMVGLWLKKNNSFFSMERTTFGNPHYINDVMEHYFKFVGEGNYESIFNQGPNIFSNRIVAPTGSDDPFYYKIEPFYGASDHDVFTNVSNRVPGIMIITWPDLYYHTSEDLANKCDATQLKRTIFLSAATAYTIVSADNDLALSIANEIFGNSQIRLGQVINRCFDKMNKSNKIDFNKTYRISKSILMASFENEKETIISTLELSDQGKNYLNHLTTALTKNYENYLEVLDKYVTNLAQLRNIKLEKLIENEIEKKAKKNIPKLNNKISELGFASSRSIFANISKDILEKYSLNNFRNTNELLLLINGKRNLLEIKAGLDAQYDIDVKLETIFNFIELLKVASYLE